MARTAKIHRLTDATVRAYARGESSRLLSDGGGLYLRRLKTGCFWYLKITSPETKATQWYSLFSDDVQATYPSKTLADARSAAGKLWRKKAQLVDPRAEKQRLRAAQTAEDLARNAQAELEKNRLTVRALFERWKRAELQPNTRADGTRSGRKDGGAWVEASFERRVFPVVGAQPAADIRRSDALAILDAAKSQGRLRTANVLLADLKQMFRFAVHRELIHKNPLDGIEKKHIGGADVERQRFLTTSQIQQLALALPTSGLPPKFQSALWIILATACRVGELTQARWADIDLKARVWHLPDTKNQRPHDIHLSEFALRHFRALTPEDPMQPWLFANRTGTAPIDVASFGKQIADRQRLVGEKLPGRTNLTEGLVLEGGRWTAHDLRRTAATMMAGLGVSTDVIDECLNHKLLSKVARVYIRDRRFGEQRQAFEALGSRLTDLLGGVNETAQERESHRVMPLRRLTVDMSETR